MKGSSAVSSSSSRASKRSIRKVASSEIENRAEDLKLKKPALQVSLEIAAPVVDSSSASFPSSSSSTSSSSSSSVSLVAGADDADACAVLRRSNRLFAAHPCSSGSNNVCTVSGARVVTQALASVRALDANSVFVDFGCSAGGVCLYVAAHYKCRVYGVEVTKEKKKEKRKEKQHRVVFFVFSYFQQKKNKTKQNKTKPKVESEPVRLAAARARAEGLDGRCSFLEGSFHEKRFEGWLAAIGATHIFAYDKVFSAEHWNHLFGKLISNGPQVVGISCAQKKGCTLPQSFEVVIERTQPASVMGGKAGFQLRVWKAGKKK